MDTKVFAVQHQFDVSKICRLCLSEKGEMRSVFIVEESLGQAVRIADMIMDFTSVQVIINNFLICFCLQTLSGEQRMHAFTFISESFVEKVVKTR